MYDQGYRGGAYGGPGYYSGGGAGYGYTGWGTRVGYGDDYGGQRYQGRQTFRGGYDHQGGYGYGGGYGGQSYRRPPEQSRFYGRSGDEAARRFARSHGYDAGYAIQPNQSGRFGGYQGGGRDYAGRGGYGRSYRGYPGWNERDYDWGYRW